MKKLSLLLVLVMVLSTVSSAFAAAPMFATVEEDPEAEALFNSPVDFQLIEADETTGQVRLTYLEGITTILEVDGLKFKDLNKNGTLDVYEDWRKDTEERVQDLLSQLTAEEEAGLHFCSQPEPIYAARDMIETNYNSCILFNLNGSPVTVVNNLNQVQAVNEEQRLGIPMTFCSDREYNAFGGYIDKAHVAFGTADDPELAYQLGYIYGQAMMAVGIHVTFEPYANEIGAQYGENPEHIAAIVSAEIKGLEDAGFASCTKHWIGRGGDDGGFDKAASVAQNWENWMVGWRAALIDGGAEWVMTNCAGKGFAHACDPKWDSETMGYLRNELGFNGVVVTDWWPLDATQNEGEVDLEGNVLKDQTIEWLYARAIELGTDVFGTRRFDDAQSTEDLKARELSIGANHPFILVNAYNNGTMEQMGNVEAYHESSARILRFKFNKGLFENPYRVTEEALAIVASPEFQAEQWEIITNEDLRKARNPKEVELTEKLQAKSAVLMKNDGNILPLAKGTKIYMESSSNDTLDHYKQYLANYGEIVEDMAAADVVVGYFGSINDATELMIEDAQDAGKPIVLTLTSKADEYALTNSTALLYIPFNQQPDHGSGEAGFIYTTEPWVYADLLFGVCEPEGIIQKEQARNTVEDNEQWRDLAGDQGASPYVRLMVQATMEDDPNHASPNNWGDPLVTYQFGMRYGQEPDFKYSCLILPTVQETVEVESGSSTTTQTNVWNETKAGEPFTAYVLLRNNGADGITTVQAKANGEVVAEKIMTVEGGSWRVVQIDLTLDAGEYTIDIGGQTDTIIIK